MNVHLTFQDLIRLASNHTLEKDGVTITLQALPMQIKVEPRQDGDAGKIEFWVEKEEAESRSLNGEVKPRAE